MTIVVTGDRKWTNVGRIREVLVSLKAEYGDFLLIEGGCPTGADMLAAREAYRLSLEVETYRAEWEKWGTRAGPERNRRMLNEKPDLVAAFHNDLSHSRGTKDCVEEAKRRGIPVRVFAETGEEGL